MYGMPLTHVNSKRPAPGPTIGPRDKWGEGANWRIGELAFACMWICVENVFLYHVKLEWLDTETDICVILNSPPPPKYHRAD